MSGVDEYNSLLNEFLSEKEIEQSKIKGDFTAKLIRARRLRNLTQKELAQKAGVKQSAIARIENEGVIPRLDTVYRILNAFDSEFIVDVKEFIEEQKEIIKEQKIDEQNEKILSELKKINYKVDIVAKSVLSLSNRVENIERDYKVIREKTEINENNLYSKLGDTKRAFVGYQSKDIGEFYAQYGEN